jgi:pyridoxamine 5'-phosphate oxidase
MNDLSNYRKSYEKSELLESNITKDPINLFNKWFQEAEEFGGDSEVNAMSLSTIGLDGFPKIRVVLLKKFTEEGFIFYTNYDSEKGKSIAENANVCLSFFWQSMERQVIIKGIAKRIDPLTSDAYFESRPEGSKIGAIVSDQSEIIPSRNFLEEKLQALENHFEGIEIPRPDNWGGFIVTPLEVEFWQGRPNRLHDRIRYKGKSDFTWEIDRLSP